MNNELELHDSTLAEIRREDSSLTSCLDEAIVHHSEGQPDVNSGICLTQRGHAPITDG